MTKLFLTSPGTKLNYRVSVFGIIFFFLSMLTSTTGFSLVAPVNDNYASAIDVGSTGGASALLTGSNCTASAFYSLVSATSDMPPGAPAAPFSFSWGYGPNVWFKFTATTTYIYASATTSNLFRYSVAIWDPANTTWLANSSTLSPCAVTANAPGTVSMKTNSLTIGNTYYICINCSNTGTFQLCCSDVVSNDYWEGATDVTSLINGSCTSASAYNNTCATPDGAVPPGGCIGGGSQNYDNVWFKFIASSTGFIEIDLTVDGSGTALFRPGMSICTTPTNSATYLTCSPSPYLNNNNGTAVFTSLVTPGTTYYINVTSWANSQGSFGLCLNDGTNLGYDSWQNALSVNNLINTCSSNHAYSITSMTSDGISPNCGFSFNSNVWFTFVATSTIMRVEAKTDGTSTGLGDLYRTSLAVCTTPTVSGTYTCNANTSFTNNNNGTAYLTLSSLTVGTKYYIDVGTWGSGGSCFSLCITEGDNDFYQTPVLLTNLNSACYSGGSQYCTGPGATIDGPTPACWIGGVKYTNRWFKFQAIGTTVTYTVSQVDGQRYETALYNTGTSTTPLPAPTLGMILQCGTMGFGPPIVIASVTVPGNWYYIEVDQWNGSTGNFQLCINNDGPSYYAIANADWHSGTTWSFGPYGGAQPAAGSWPTSSNQAYIQGYSVTVSQSESCAGLNITAQTANTGLTIDGTSGGKLVVNGNLTATNAGQAVNNIITVQNTGTLTVVDNINYTSSGASSGTLQLNVGNSSSDNSRASAGIDMVWTVSGTGTTSNDVNINGNSSLTIARDMNLTYTGGNKITLTSNDAGTIAVTRDVNFSVASASKEEIILNGTSTFKIGRKFTQSASGYGKLTSTANATLEFNGVLNSNYFLGTNTAPEAFTLYNIKVNNTFSAAPEVNLTGPTTMQGGTLYLTAGYLKPTSTNVFTMNAGTLVSPVGGQSTSFVDGPMKKVGATDFIFPTGNSTKWARVSVTNLSASSTFQAQYFKKIYLNTAVVSTMATSPSPALDHVSWNEYWQLDRVAGGNANVTLYWEDASFSGITDCSDLKIGHYNGSSWENNNNVVTTTNCTGTTPGTTGTIATNAVVTSFSPFTFGSISSQPVNPLPVTWLTFEPYCAGNRLIDVNWSTATETNNNYYKVVRSADAVNFHEVGRYYAKGNSLIKKDYTVQDVVPENRLWYYRVIQYDLNGDSSFTEIRTVNVDQGPQVTFYPNPALEELTIDNIPADWENVSLVVYDVTGKKVKEMNFNGEKFSNVHLYLNEFATGRYILQLLDTKGQKILSSSSFIKAQK